MRHRRLASLLYVHVALALGCGSGSVGTPDTEDGTQTSSAETSGVAGTSSTSVASAPGSGSTTMAATSSSGPATGAVTTGSGGSSTGSGRSSSSGTGEPTTGEASWEPLVFSVMGDVPYAPEEYGVLVQQVADHNATSPSEFMVHVGDIKSGSPICFEVTFADVSEILLGLAVPTFVLPGDNEWNDCILNIDASWGWWVEYFSRFNEAWPASPIVERQDVRDENFAWTSEGVLLVGINLVGGFVHDAGEWAERLEQDAQWVESQFEDHPGVYAAVIFAHAHPTADHAAYVSRMESAALDFGRPVLFIHGDGHSWIDDVPFAAPNIRRIQVDRGGNAPPLQVTVDENAAEVFATERMPL